MTIRDLAGWAREAPPTPLPPLPQLLWEYPAMGQLANQPGKGLGGLMARRTGTRMAQNCLC